MISASDFLTQFGDLFGNGTKYANMPEDPAYVEAPTGLDYTRGTKPMDTLPAQWWNWLNKEYTGKLNELRTASENVFGELDNLLALVGVSPDETDDEQLKDMFDGLYQNFLAKWLQTDAGTMSSVEADHTYALAVSDCDATDPSNPEYTLKKALTLPIALGGTGAATGQDAMDNLTASLATQTPAVGTETVLVKSGTSTREMSMSDLASYIAGLVPQASGVPAGSITAYGGATAPDGWHLCDGSALSSSDYPDLYAAIGTTWGTGDGVTTDFNIPDMRGRAPMGADSDNVLGLLQADQVQNHKHSITDPGHIHNLNGYVSGSNSSTNLPNCNLTRVVDVSTYTTLAGKTGITIGNPSSGNHGTETRPKNARVNFIIKF